MRPSDKIHSIFSQAELKTNSNVDNVVLDDAIRALSQSKQSKPVFRPDIWSKIMRSNITKSAAAAIVFIAVILGINLIPGSKGPVALASVIETFKNAVCISYDMKMGDDSPPIHDTVHQNIIRREVLGATAIIDLENQKILTLNPAEKQAVEMSFDGLPEMPKNYIDHLVNILTKLQQKEKITSEELGTRETNGAKQIGYFFDSDEDNVQVEIWMNVDTSLPAGITAIRPGLTITIDNFNFDENIDLALFEMTPPEGYTLMNTQGIFDFKKDANEETFIEGLRLQATLYDGWFPQDVSIESYVKRAPEIGSLLEQKFEGTFAQMQAGIKLGKSLIFLRFWKGQSPWHYAGNGVKLGQAEEPIFWYQPKDSEVFRVIFGDLHVEEVLPEDIDILVANRAAFTGIGYQIWDRPDIVVSQDDEWHVTNTDTIEVHSTIDIRKGPLELSELTLTLPYENAALLSAQFGDLPLEFESEDNLQYAFYPAGEDLAAGTHMIRLLWKFPMENLELADYGYVVPLQSFLPATAYKITAVLEPDCGFVWGFSPEDMKKAHEFMPTREPDNPQMLGLFSCDHAEAETSFGTCGLNIKPK